MKRRSREGVLVVGATSPIGRVAATWLATKGAPTVLWDRNLTQVDRIAEALRSFGCAVRVDAGDLDTDTVDHVLGAVSLVVETRAARNGAPELDVMDLAARAIRHHGVDYYLRVSPTGDGWLSGRDIARLRASALECGVGFGVMRVGATDDDPVDKDGQLAIARVLDMVLDDSFTSCVSVRLDS